MKKVVTVAAVIMLASAVQANDNPIVDTVDNAKDFAVNNQVSQFVVQEYNDILDFQAESWQQGKDQLGRNKEQIVSIFSNVKDAFQHYFIKDNK